MDDVRVRKRRGKSVAWEATGFVSSLRMGDGDEIARARFNLNF